MTRTLLFIVALLCALPVGAQPRVVGVLFFDPPEAQVTWDQLLGGGLRALGYKDGQTHVIEYRWANGDITRYPMLARELVARRPAVIVAPCGPSQRAIREIARTLPIIAICADEINFLGEVASRARPGGHTTGLLMLSAEAVGKRLQLLREIRPDMSRIAVLHDANDPIPAIWRELERLQPILGISLQRLPVGLADGLDAAFESMVRERAQAVYVIPDNRMMTETARIAELARKYRLATIFEYPFGVEAGLLLSYGASIPEVLGKTVPMYVDKILKGAKAGDLPVVQPTLLNLVVNLKTAREIGIKIPQSIILRADRVIE
jgi:putative ABC transport system substrate-binding protein